MHLNGFLLSGLVVRLAARSLLPGHRKRNDVAQAPQKERLAPALLRVAGSMLGGIPGNLFWGI